MKTFGRFLILTAALLSIHSSAQIVTTYSSLGEPGDTYATGNGWLVNGSANPPQPYVGETFAFTPTVSGRLSQVRVAIGADQNLATDLANILIAADGGRGLPGPTLESFLNVSCPGFFGAQNPLVSLTSVVNPNLQAGGTYWICVMPALPTAAVTVNQNNQGLQALQAQVFSSGWYARGNKTTFAFDVAVAVPEPSATAVLVAGLCLLLSPLARRSRTGRLLTDTGRFARR